MCWYDRRECNNQNNYLFAHGILLNKNTIEQFKDCNKTELIQNESKRVWNYIASGEAIDNPSLLNFFFILSYAVRLNYFNYYVITAFNFSGFKEVSLLLLVLLPSTTENQC